MLVIPLLGWFASMTYGGRTNFFGLFELPQLLGKDVDAAVLHRNGHIWLGWLLFAILVLHIGAVVVSDIKEGNGLISAMFSGRKVFTEEPRE